MPTATRAPAETAREKRAVTGGMWHPQILADEHSTRLDIPKYRKKETRIAESTDAKATHTDGISQNYSRANGADGERVGWGLFWAKSHY